MKRILSAILIGLTFNSAAFSQDISITLEYRSGPDSFYVYVTPAFGSPAMNIGTSGVTIIFSNTFPVSNPPTASITTTAVAGGGWIPQDYAEEPTGSQKKFVSFLTTGGPLGAVAANQRILLFRYRVSGGNCSPGTFSRVFVNGTDPVDPLGVFADFTTFLNIGGVDHLASNSNVSLQSCLQLTLPVNILEFNARKDNNNAVINWSVTGEDAKGEYYMLERSTDGNIFQPIANVNCRKQPGVQQYEYTDINVNLLNSKYVYYRLRQYDIDARFIMSGVRHIRLDINDKDIQVFPNPVKEGFYVRVPLKNAGNETVMLNLISLSGQVMKSIEITALQASNYYFDLKGLSIATGQYSLQVIQDGSTLTTRKLVINK